MKKHDINDIFNIFNILVGSLFIYIVSMLLFSCTDYYKEHKKEIESMYHTEITDSMQDKMETYYYLNSAGFFK